MKYQEWKDARQKEFNELPIFYAFGQQQFREQMEKRGLTEDDTDKIYAIGCGGYYLRSDADVIREYFEKPDVLPGLMGNKEFAKSAFYYEMCNHEYGINWQGDWDVCQCFGNCEYGESKSGTDYLKEMGYGDVTVQAYRDARRKYYKMAEKNEWF